GRHLGVCRFPPRSLDRDGKSVGVTLKCIARAMDTDQMWDCGVRSLTDVALMVQLLPKLAPRRRDVRAALKREERLARVIRPSITTSQLAPPRIIEAQHPAHLPFAPGTCIMPRFVSVSRLGGMSDWGHE